VRRHLASPQLPALMVWTLAGSSKRIASDITGEKSMIITRIGLDIARACSRSMESPQMTALAFAGSYVGTTCWRSLAIRNTALSVLRLVHHWGRQLAALGHEYG